MADNTVTDKVVISYESTGAQEFAANAKNATDSINGIVVAGDKVEKSTGSIDSKFAALERRFGTTAGQATQLAKVQKSVNDALAANPALQDRANEVLAAASARYGAAAEAEKVLTSAHAGLDTQGQAALHSIRSLGEQLLLGVPPTQALAGQINHLTYAATGEGGLVGAFKQVGQFVGGLATPFNLAIAGTVGLTAAAAALAIQYDKVQVSAQRALNGAGARTGTTVSDINNFTAQNSSGFGLSSKEARGLAEDLTATGEIVIGKLHGMSNAVVGFANQTGVSVDQASKAFVQFATDPQKALLELSKVFGDFDAETRNSVQALSLAGDKTAAFQAIVDALAEKTKQAADNAGFLEKAWRGIVNVLASETVKPTGIENQIDAVKKQLDAAIDGASRLAPDDARLSGASESVEKLSKAFADLYAQQQKDQSNTVAAKFNTLSTSAQNLEKSIFPQIDAIAQLDEAIKKLEEAKAAGAGDANTDNAIAVYSRQADLLQEQLGTQIRQAQVVGQLSAEYGGVSSQTAATLSHLKDQLNIASQITAAGQIQAQGRATYNSLLVQGVASSEALQIAQAQIAVSEAQATASVEKQTQALKDQLDLMKAKERGNEEQVASAQAYRNAINSGADSTAAAALASQTLKNALYQAQSYAASIAGSARETAADWERAAAAENQARAEHDANNPDGTNFGPLKTNFGVQDNGPVSGGAVLALGLAFNNNPGAQQAHVENGKVVAPGWSQLPPPSTTDQINSALQSGGIDAAIAVAKGSNDFQNVGQLYDLKNSQTSDAATKTANLQEELAWLQSQPMTKESLSAIASLQSSIQSLTSSTDNLNATNQDLLSPYYSQDPRTSHIGFRSQGMADGGEFTVPGGYSANDNMLGVIPLASGEIVNVRRPGDPAPGDAKSITINIPVIIQGNADRDDIGRTIYQAGQTLKRQLASVA